MNKQLFIAILFTFFLGVFTTNTLMAQFCSGQTNLTAVNGSFNDGSGAANYASNSNCSWLIQPAGSPLNITLTMNSLNLSGFFDIVRVYDGTSAAGALIATYRGNNIGNTAIANSGSMFVQFTSNAFGNAQGWAASYTSSLTNCQPNTIITDNNSAFTDGTRNGSNYANNTNCEWLIQPTNPGVFVEVNFSRFTVAAGDSLILYDGIDASAPVLATLGGNTNPGTYQSSGGNLFVRFVADSTGTANGWRIVYNTQPIPFCSGLTVLNSLNGLFNDGSFPFTNYVENSNCQWLIQPTGALSVALQFNYFSTQANFDVVNVYQGTSANGVLLGSFSGNTIPPAVTSTSGSLFVEFITSNQNNSTGWEGSYTSSNVANISAALDTIYLNAGAGSRNTFQLNANSSWTATDNQSWLISSPVNGTGNQTVNLLAIQGNIGPERTAQLYITAPNGNGGDTVTVIQRSSGRFLDLPTDTLFFSATSAPSQSFNVLSNVSWTLTNSSPWISSNPTNGNNNGSPQVTISSNSTNQIRNGYITASGAQNAGSDTIYILQDSLIQSFSVSPNNSILSYTSGSFTFVQVNANLNWSLTNAASWLTISTLSGNDSTSITITANTTNLANSDRSAYLYFTAGNGRFIDSVLITQEFLPWNFSVSPSSVVLTSSAGSIDSVQVNTNLAWVLSNSTSWLTTNVTSGNDSSTVKIAANSAPLTIIDRSAYLYFNSVNGVYVDSVFVTQRGIPPYLLGSPDTFLLGMGIGEIATFNITASSSWSVNSASSWLVLNKLNGTGNDILTASSVSMNATSNPRSAQLYLEDLPNNLKDTLTVIQGGATGVIVVNPTNLRLASSSGSSAIFNINSDVNWSISGTPNWLNLTPSSGMNNGFVTASATSANQSGSDRVATLLVSGLGAISKTVTVTQLDAGTSAFLLSVDTLFVGSTNGSLEDFTVIANNSWSLTETSFWLALNKTSGTNTEVVTARAGSDNLFASPRFTTVTASSAGNADQTLVVVQLGAPLNFTYAPDSLIIGADSASFGKFTINSNLSSWSASESENWIDVSPSNGSLTSEITVTATKSNTTGLTRSGIVTLSSPPFIPLAAKVVQDTVRSIGIRERTLKQQVSIFPNPSSEVVNLKFQTEQDVLKASIEVVDLMGKSVKYESKFIARNHLVFNFSGLDQGFYFIKITMNEESFAKKILLLTN